MDDQPNNTPSIDGITPPAKPIEAQPTLNPAPDNTIQTPSSTEPVSPPDSANVPAIGDTIATDTTPNPATPTPAEASVPNLASAPKKKKPVVAIIVAIVIALGLGAATVFLYMKYSRNSNSSNTSGTSQQASNTITPATISDVDQASKQLDTSLAQADDNKDFAATAFSDQTLGL